MRKLLYFIVTHCRKLILICLSICFKSQALLETYTQFESYPNLEMIPSRKLKNPPITEALINFQVVPSSDFDVKQFSPLIDQLKDEFPQFQEYRKYEEVFGVDEGKPISNFAETGMEGFIFKSENNTHVAQFMLGGFTYNRLKPYLSWENICEKAQGLWEIYTEIASPEQINRIAVRYINHLVFPSSVFDLEQYLTEPPKIPKPLPHLLHNFLNRIVIHDDQKDLWANITQASDSLEPNTAKIILDIDVYQDRVFEIDDPEIWSVFEHLHEMKNQIFFSSLTKKGMSLFE